MARDVTDRKRAQKALHQRDTELAEAQRSVSRRLIEAQEKERTRIARNLHDDIGQPLALLAIGLEQLQQNAHDLPAETRSRMGELRKKNSASSRRWRLTSEPTIYPALCRRTSLFASSEFCRKPSTIPQNTVGDGTSKFACREHQMRFISRLATRARALTAKRQRRAEVLDSSAWRSG
jgi:hypothetical protein